MDEQSYRALADRTMQRIDEAFADADPDQAEASLANGALTITFPGNVKAIVSPQPPVRQMWLAFRDRAWHFDYDAQNDRWLDDRGKGEDLFRLVETIARDAGGVTVAIR